MIEFIWVGLVAITTGALIGAAAYYLGVAAGALHDRWRHR